MISNRLISHRFRFMIGLAFSLGTSMAVFAAQNLPAKKIYIGYSGISTGQSPAWIAYEKGFFRKHGLDVQLIFIEGGTKTVQTLISGDVTAAQVAGSSVIQSNLKKSGVVMVGGFLNTLDYKLIVSRDITRPDQLRGKTLAVSRIGGSSDFATRYALEKYGLSPDKDVNIIQIGSQPARMAALEAGKIHGSMIAVPTTAEAKKLGLNTLADLQMLGLEYQHTGLAVTQKLIKDDPTLVRNLMKAFVDAIHFLKTRRQESMQVLAKYLRTNDQDALDDAYESIALTLIPDKPYPTLKGIQTILRELGTKDPAARAASPERFVDLSFVKELDSSGYIAKALKAPAVAGPIPMVKKEIPPSAPALAKATEPSPEPIRTTENKEDKAKTVKIANSDAATAPSPSPAKKTSAKPAAAQYVVKAGDTLSKLAEHFYKSTQQWEKIYEANRDQLKNPNYIYIGMTLTIPPEGQSS